MADHVGRRPTAAVAMVGLAGFGALAYGGSRPALIVGYVLGVLSGSVLAPAVGSLLAELFRPQSVHRSPGGGWPPASSARWPAS